MLGLNDQCVEEIATSEVIILTFVAGSPIVSSNCSWLKISTSVTLSLMTEMRQLQPVVMFARSLQAPARGLLGDLKHSLLGSLGGFLDSLLSPWVLYQLPSLSC